jgi:hypothetical protein
MERLIEEAKKTIPSVDFILDETFERLNLRKEMVKRNFGKILVLVDEEAPSNVRGEKEFTMRYEYIVILKKKNLIF